MSARIMLVLLAGWNCIAVAEQPCSIAAVLALSDEQLRASPLASVQGTVTLSVPRMMVIQDGDAAIFVSGPRMLEGVGPDRYPDVPLGSLVKLTGRAVPAGYSPTLIADYGRLLGRGPLPAARPADMARLFRGADTGLRVAVQGVVQGLGERSPQAWALVLDADARRLIVLVPKTSGELPPEDLIDAEVRVTGIVGAIHNSRGEFLSPEIAVVSTDDLEVLRGPATDAFAAPLIPLEGISRYSGQPRSSRRVRTAGTVTYAGPGLLFLADGAAGVRVDLASHGAAATESSRLPFGIGDRVEVAGFVDMTRSIGGLTGALARRMGTATPPVAMAVHIDDIKRLDSEFRRKGWTTAPGSFDGRLVRCGGRIEGLETTPEGLVATLFAEGTHWLAEFGSFIAPAAAKRLAVGSDVEVTGILRVDLQTARVNGLVSGHPSTGRITVLARTANDVDVIRPAPWWTPRRLAVAMGGLVATFAASSAGALVLGREVRRQAVVLAETMRSQREATIEFGATLRERNRLAANLHDTVLQTVTGIGYQLQACETAGPSTGRDPGRLQVARRMVTHAVEQLRGTVWALHTMPAGEGSFAAGLESLVDRLREGHHALISYTIAGCERPVPPTVSANLLLVAQEAVLNARRHAHASAIELTVDFGDDATVAVTVRDDGQGFTMGDQPGAVLGHFGIEGMIDRMLAVDGECRVESRPGQGTVVRAVAPAATGDDDLSDRAGREPACRGLMSE